MDIEGIRKWHKVFKRDDELFELRLVGERNTLSGYFYDVEVAIENLQPYDNYNIYFSVNEVKRACASRSQFDCFRQVKGSATSKQDIEHRWWIPIDVDCERPSGISSTDEEKARAHDKAGDVYRFLKANGLSAPIVCDSSSGYHLYLPIDMDNTPEAELTIKTFLETLGNRFTDEHIKIDNVLFDANRIIRLPGTFGRKGRNTAERPHRLAKILSVPEEIVRMKKEDIDAFNGKYKVVAELPIRQYGYNNGSRDEFDLRKFITDHGISVAKEVPLVGGGTKYVLTECLFDPMHKSPDAAIFQMPNGAIGYKCFHQSCSCYDWKDVRRKFEPDAYENRPRNYQPSPYQHRNVTPQPETKPSYDTSDDAVVKRWKQMREIKKVNILDIPHFLTGFTELDRVMKGLFDGDVTILSGLNSSGKSSWLNTLVLNIIDQGIKVAMWSGELTDYMLKSWIQMAAAGKEYLKPTRTGDYWYVPDPIAVRIDEWMDDKLLLFDNEYPPEWSLLFSDMESLADMGVKVFVLDNLMSLDIDIFEGTDNQRQTELMKNIKNFAQRTHTHVILVAHPKKVTTFLRKTDISGTAVITNLAANVLIVHRVNNDFKKTGGEFFGAAYISQFYGFGNVIEITKNRIMGGQDVLCGIYYEIESRRFKNTADERKIYGWHTDSGSQTTMFEERGGKDAASGLDWDKPFDDPTEDMPF